MTQEQQDILKHLEQYVDDDGLAASYQTIGQYRVALLHEIKMLQRTPTDAKPKPETRTTKEIGVAVNEACLCAGMSPNCECPACQVWRKLFPANDQD
jgi:hypothetical protein